MKIESFNSPELNCIKDIFNQLQYLQLDVNIAYIIESYMYKWIEEKDKEGNVKCRYRIKFNEKDGEYKEWFKDTQNKIVKKQKNYTQGKLNGEYIEYYPKGKIHIKKSFINDKLDGEFKMWYPYYTDYQLCEQKYYLDGKLNGIYTTWTVRGQLYSERTFIKGKMQEDKIWNEYGIIRYHYLYKNGKEFNLIPNNN